MSIAFWSFPVPAVCARPIHFLRDFAVFHRPARHPEVAVDERCWTTQDPELAKPLIDNGALMSVLTVLFNDRPPRCEPEDILDDPEDDVLLNHYLNHHHFRPLGAAQRGAPI